MVLRRPSTPRSRNAYTYPQSSSSASPATHKRLAASIIDYLRASLQDGTVSQEDAESIEVATSCISDAFKIAASDPSLKPGPAEAQSLLSIYSVYETLNRRTTPTTDGPSSAVDGQPGSPLTSGEKPPANPEAEKLKGQGNVAMQAKEYAKAIELYTKAIDIAPTNAIYLSNRAAAYSGAGQHDLARNDAEMATASDPKYTKAWSRLGLSRFALGDAKGSMEAYKQGIEAEGNGGSDAMKRGYETAKRRVLEQGGSTDDIASPRSTSPIAGGGGMPDLGSLASMFGGGGAGGQGGMPDLGALMNNPMMRQMAQNLMSDPNALSGLMNNPRIREMANQFGAGGGGGSAGTGGQRGQGGGMPDLSSLMNDPSIAEMARNFMGGGAGGAGGAGRGAGGGA